MKQITSRDNPQFKQLRGLANSSRERRKQNKILLDGMHLVQAYGERFGFPETIAISESGAKRPEIAAYLNAHPEASPLVFSDVLFGEISPVAMPTGILAIVTTPVTTLSIASATTSTKQTDVSCVLLDAVQDPGNLGSILRSTAAAGIVDVFLSEGCALAWSPRVLRAAMGAHFSLQIHEHAVLEDVLRNHQGLSVSTSLQGNKTIYEIDLKGPVAWLFGNEGAGLSPSIEKLAQHSVLIPMSSATESLNVAAAAAICLFEEVRQKRQNL